MSELIEIKKHVSIVEVALNRQQTYNAFNLEMVGAQALYPSMQYERKPIFTQPQYLDIFFLF